MTFKLDELSKKCRIWPNIWNDINQKDIKIGTSHRRKVTLYLIPFKILDSTEILYIEKDTNPLYKVGNYLKYTVYIRNKLEIPFVSSYLSTKDVIIQNILSKYWEEAFKLDSKIAHPLLSTMKVSRKRP